MIKNIAIIGFGEIGKKHYHSLLRSKKFKVHSIVEPKRKINVNNTVNIYKNIDLFIEKEKNNIDFVSICTPSNSHFNLIKKSISNNINVICEKPLALKTLEVNQIKKILKLKKKIKLYEVRQLRFLPIVNFLKKKLSSQKNKKKVKLINLNLFLNRSLGYYKKSPWRGTINGDGGAIFNQFIHHLDLIKFLTNAKKIKIVSYHFSKRKNIETEDMGFLNLIINNQIFVNFNFILSSPINNFSSNLNIICEKNCYKVNFSDLSRCDEVFKNLKNKSKVHTFQSLDLFLKFYDNVHQSHFLNKKNNLLVTNDDSFKMIKLIEQIYNKRNEIF